MMERNKAQKSQSFLQKFQGRRKIVGKEGVLLLLQQKIQEMGQKMKVILSNREPNLPKMESHSLNNKLPQPTSLDRQKQQHIILETLKASHSQRNALQKYNQSPKRVPSLTDTRLNKRQVRSQQLVGGKSTLPLINQRSRHSRSSHKIKAANVIVRNRGNLQKSESSPVKGGRYQRLSEKIMQQMARLDAQALRHLQRLDSFQKLMMKQKLQSGRQQSLSQLN